MAANEQFTTHHIGMMSYCRILGFQLFQKNTCMPISEAARKKKSLIMEFLAEFVEHMNDASYINNGRLDHLIKKMWQEFTQEIKDVNERIHFERFYASFSQNILQNASLVSKNNRFSTKELLVRQFGGAPEFNQIVGCDGTKAIVDILARGPNAGIAWKLVIDDGMKLDEDHELRNAVTLEAMASAIICQKSLGHKYGWGLIFEDGRTRWAYEIPQEMSDRFEEIRNGASLSESIDSVDRECKNCPFYSSFCETNFLIEKSPIDYRYELIADALGSENEKENSILNEIVQKHEIPTVTVEPNEPCKEISVPSLSASSIRTTCDSVTRIILGRIKQNPNKQLELCVKAEKDKINAGFSSKYASVISRGSILLASSPYSEDKLLARIIQTKSSDKIAVVGLDTHQAFECNAVLQPIGLLRCNSCVEVPPMDFDGWNLSFPMSEDWSIYLNLPESGIIFGHIPCGISGIEKIPYKYDFRSLARKSMFVCGGQGTGKTTFLRHYILQLLAEPDSPSIVILDVDSNDRESQFQSLVRYNPEKVRTLRLSSLTMKGEISLSSEEIEPSDISRFVPNLPTKTADMLNNVATEVFGKASQNGKKPAIYEILQGIERAIEGNWRLYKVQKTLIAQSMVSPAFKLFDIPETKGLSSEFMLQPGMATIIDATDLNTEEQRTVAIYLMNILDRARIRERNKESYSRGVLLVLDEANRLFPQGGGLSPDYVKRIAMMVDEITHRGRKHNYGIVMATQSPQDICKNIVNLCETKIFFRIAGNQTWLNEHVGDSNIVRGIGNLGDFRAYVIIKGSSRKPVEICFPNVSA